MMMISGQIFAAHKGLSPKIKKTCSDSIRKFNQPQQIQREHNHCFSSFFDKLIIEIQLFRPTYLWAKGIMRCQIDHITCKQGDYFGIVEKIENSL